jgi:hypothetical protein
MHATANVQKAVDSILGTTFVERMGVRRDRELASKSSPASNALSNSHLGQGGVVLCPGRHRPAGDLRSPLGDELVLPQGVLDRLDITE